MLVNKWTEDFLINSPNYQADDTALRIFFQYLLIIVWMRLRQMAIQSNTTFIHYFYVNSAINRADIFNSDELHITATCPTEMMRKDRIALVRRCPEKMSACELLSWMLGDLARSFAPIIRFVQGSGITAISYTAVKLDKPVNTCFGVKLARVCVSLVIYMAHWCIDSKKRMYLHRDTHTSECRCKHFDCGAKK